MVSTQKRLPTAARIIVIIFIIIIIILTPCYLSLQPLLSLRVAHTSPHIPLKSLPLSLFFPLPEDFPGCYRSLLSPEAQQSRSAEIDTSRQGKPSTGEGRCCLETDPTSVTGAILRCLLHSPQRPPVQLSLVRPQQRPVH